MSPPPPRRIQHLVTSAGCEHYSASQGCQEQKANRRWAPSRMTRRHPGKRVSDTESCGASESRRGASRGGAACALGDANYGMTRWTGLPRMFTCQVVMSCPVPSVPYSIFHQPPPAPGGSPGATGAVYVVGIVAEMVTHWLL